MCPTGMRLSPSAPDAAAAGEGLAVRALFDADLHGVFRLPTLVLLGGMTRLDTTL